MCRNTFLRVAVKTGATIAVNTIPGIAAATNGCHATSNITANTSLAANVPAGPAIMRAHGSFFNTVRIIYFYTDAAAHDTDFLYPRVFKVFHILSCECFYMLYPAHVISVFKEFN